jgi:hypothetical protein
LRVVVAVVVVGVVELVIAAAGGEVLVAQAAVRTFATEP